MEIVFLQGNLNFARKLPPGAESATILVGEVEFVARPVCAFVRMKNDICLGNLTEVNVATRFIFVLLGPPGNAAKYHEVGRAVGACCSDDVRAYCFSLQKIPPSPVEFRGNNRRLLSCLLSFLLADISTASLSGTQPQLRPGSRGKIPPWSHSFTARRMGSRSERLRNQFLFSVN